MKSSNPNKKNKSQTFAVFFAAFVMVFFTSSLTRAQMSSSVYKIQSDSVNFGGVQSTSTSYGVEDTFGEIATGLSSSAQYAMSAGYQAMQETFISVTPPSNVTLSPAIGGLSGGTANGDTNFTVITDNPAGYSVTLAASSSPALSSAGDSFADYVPAGAVPDLAFSNASTNSSFAFTVEGSDIDSRYLDNGSACGIGSADLADACWDGLSTSNRTIVSRASGNHPNGSVTTLKFRAESGSSHVQQSGLYVATTTVTVLVQ